MSLHETTTLLTKRVISMVNENLLPERLSRMQGSYMPSPLNKSRREFIREVRKGVRTLKVDLVDFVWYYREHPVEACQDILKISLMPYQKEILRQSWRKPFPLWVMSRGSGKSYLAAIDMALNALLFPRMRIGIIAPSYRQSKFLFLKFQEEVYNRSAVVRAQCEKPPSAGTQECMVKFRNGSFIQALPFGANNGGNNIRGQRYNCIYIDEFASIDEQIVRLVVEPMLTVKRAFDPNNPDDSESNRVVIFSSAYYTWNHFYNKTQSYLSRVKKNDPDYYVAIVDYKMPLKYGLYDEKAIAKAQRDNTEGDFQMEYGSTFQSEGTGTWIPVSLFDRRVTWDQDLEPMMVGDRNKSYHLYCDFSISDADNADNTTFLIEERDPLGKARIVSMKARRGMTLDEIHQQIRDYFIKFGYKTLTMDGEKLGLAIKGYLAEEYIHPTTQEVIPPFLEVDNKDPDKEGLRIVTMIKHAPELNHTLGLAAKRMVEQRKIVMPVLQDRHEDPEIEMAFLELIALKKEITNVKAVPNGLYYKYEQEKKSKLKRDRWTTFMYMCYQFEKSLGSEEEDDFYLEVI
jgi:hypothetical protein